MRFVISLRSFQLSNRTHLLFQAAWKRIVSVLQDLGKIEAAAKELCEYLDTFYNDVEAWIELSSIYASCNR
jgi:hypothetical protein